MDVNEIFRETSLVQLLIITGTKWTHNFKKNFRKRLHSKNYISAQNIIYTRNPFPAVKAMILGKIPTKSDLILLWFGPVESTAPEILVKYVWIRPLWTYTKAKLSKSREHKLNATHPNRQNAPSSIMEDFCS